MPPENFTYVLNICLEGSSLLLNTKDAIEEEDIGRWKTQGSDSIRSWSRTFLSHSDFRKASVVVFNRVLTTTAALLNFGKFNFCRFASQFKIWWADHERESIYPILFWTDKDESKFLIFLNNMQTSISGQVTRQ